MERKDQPSHIVVVEDDPTFLKFWKRFLAEMGLADVSLFAEPLAAREHLKQTPCALLICDIILPSITGFDLAIEAKELHPAMPVLLTTAYVWDLSRFPLGNHEFHLLHKPYQNLSELKRLIVCLMNGANARSDASEDSCSDNEDYPTITEWKI